MSSFPRTYWKSFCYRHTSRRSQRPSNSIPTIREARTMIRRSLALLAILAICATSLSAQRQQQQQQTVAELVINVTYDDNNEAPKMCRVQLLTSSRMPISDQFA